MKSGKERLIAIEDERYGRLNERLRETFSDLEAARAWRSAPNRYLGGMQPIESLRARHFDRVNAALEVIDAGIFV
jgi:hypothetical protein